MIRVAVAVAVVAVAALVSWATRLRLGSSLGVAVLRAAVQLAALALVVEAIFDQLGLAVAFVGVMLTAASWTTAGRWGPIPGGRRLAALAIGLGAGLVLGVVFTTSAFERTPRYVIPLAGIVIGGSMSAASVAGRRVRDDIADLLPSVEARLALGASARTALQPLVRRATVTGLVPALDQTKNVGLVTLPGAFVGMLLGGATPLEAAQVQLTVLFLLLGAETVAATAATHLVARAHIAPGDRVVVPVRERA